MENEPGADDASQLLDLTDRADEVFCTGTMGELARREFAEFDCAQVSAIVSYLWWRLEQDEYSPEIEQALENYWTDREAECRDASRVVT